MSSLTMGASTQKNVPSTTTKFVEATKLTKYEKITAKFEALKIKEKKTITEVRSLMSAYLQLEDKTPSAKPIHRIEVGDVCVSLFPNDRATLQRRYRDRDGKTAYADSLRPSHWASARRALEMLEEWHADHVSSQPSGDA